MRYNSPLVQLGILYLAAFFTSYLISMFDPTIEKSMPPVSPEPNYPETWRSYLVQLLTLAIGTLALNIVGAHRFVILWTLLVTLKSILRIVVWRTQSSKALYAQYVFMDIETSARVLSTYTILLSYPGEKRRALSLSVFVFSGRLFSIFGLLIAKHTDPSETVLAGLLSGALVAAVASVGVSWALSRHTDVVRDSGVYLVPVRTSVMAETRALLHGFGNLKVVLLVPVMLLPGYLSRLYYDVFMIPSGYTGQILSAAGVLAIVLVAGVLDVSSRYRIQRAWNGYLVVFALTALSVSLTAVLWSTDSVRRMFVASGSGFAQAAGMVVKSEKPVLYATLFFNLLSFQGTMLFEFWIVGTLTNDTMVMTRLAGVLYFLEGLGYTLGAVLVEQVVGRSHMIDMVYVGVGWTVVAFACLAFVVRTTNETNTWTLPVIEDPVAPAAAAKHH